MVSKRCFQRVNLLENSIPKPYNNPKQSGKYAADNHFEEPNDFYM